MFQSVHFSSSVLSDSLRPQDCNTPGFPIHHQLLELAQTHVHWVGDAIQPSHPLSSPFSSCLQSFPESGSFPMSLLFTSGGQSIKASASASVPLVSWFPLGLTGLITLLSKGLSRAFSSTAVWKHQFFGTQSSLRPTLTPIRDHRKSHSFEYMDLCWQSDASAFECTV